MKSEASQEIQISKQFLQEDS